MTWVLGFAGFTGDVGATVVGVVVGVVTALQTPKPELPCTHLEDKFVSGEQVRTGAKRSQR